MWMLPKENNFINNLSSRTFGESTPVILGAGGMAGCAGGVCGARGACGGVRQVAAHMVYIPAFL